MKMKSIKIIFAVIFAIAISGKVNAQNNTVKIQTSAVCDQCKDRIENDLSFEKGVKSSHLDQKTKVVTVVYNPAKTDEQKIREAIISSLESKNELIHNLDKRVHEKTVEVVAQKNEIENKNVLLEEKQKEILDSIHYAKRIQTALIPSDKYISKNLTRLQNKG